MRHLALTLAALLPLWGCSNSNFSGASKAKDSKDDKADGKGDTDGADGADGADGKDGTAANPDGKTSVNGGDGFMPTGGAVGTGDSKNAGTVGTGTDASNSSFRFGLLVNEPRCAMCHLTVNGDVASTASVDRWNTDAAGTFANDNSTPNIVNGTWFAASIYSTLTTTSDGQPSTVSMPIVVTGGVKQNYRGPELPAVSGNPQFPVLDMAKVKASVSGTLTGKSLTDGAAVSVKNVYNGNLTITGDKANPVKITGDVFVTGDLVIKGYYTGVGSIYAGGRIYIPANLRAVNNVFPYPTDRAAALAKAKQEVANHTGDALGLATDNSIFIADLASTLYDDGRDPANAIRANAGVDEVYSWYPGGQVGYESLYETTVSCLDSSPIQGKSFNAVDAYLYSAKTIGGISRTGSWAINGGIITDSLHIIGRGGRGYPEADNIICIQPTVSPVHGLPMNSNYVNYDFRLQVGLRLLSKMAAYYEH